jgi:tetratricopeptide (TPR) repeat protein
VKAASPGIRGFEALLASAQAHAGRREFPQAIADCEAALRLHPEDAEALVQLSYLHSLSGHYRQGRDHALRAARAGTTSPKVLAELVQRLRTFNALPELQACIGRLRPLSSVPIPLLIAIAAQLSYVNMPGQAIEYLDEARRGDPDYPATLLARAQVLIYLGRFDEAARDIDRARQRAPQIAHGYWLRSMLGAGFARPGDAAAIRSQLARPDRTAADTTLLGLALHRTLDERGEHAEAWQALSMACRAKRTSLRYDIAETTALVDALVSLPAHRAEPCPAQDGAAVPIFIVGMHRSGTTLLEQLLDGSPQVHGIGELYDFTSAMREATDHHCRGVIDATIVARAANIDLAAAGRSYLQGIAWRLHGEPFFTDKLPSNFLNLGFICRALPQARILHMVRDPVETCFSNLRELFSDANPWSYDQLELAAYYRQYRRLMAHWHDRWPGRILDVDYARLTREPEPVMREVAAFCGVAFDPAMLEHRSRSRGVATASAVQVRDRVTAREQPKWAPYREYLQPLIGALAD